MLKGLSLSYSKPTVVNFAKALCCPKQSSRQLVLIGCAIVHEWSTSDRASKIKKATKVFYSAKYISLTKHPVKFPSNG